MMKIEQHQQLMESKKKVEGLLSRYGTIIRNGI
jgi:hypothetical protein